MGTTLVVNPGSSSKKYALYKKGQVVLEYSFESSKHGYEAGVRIDGSSQTCQAISQTDFLLAFSGMATRVKEYLVAERATLSAICVRIVAPGSIFQKHTVIDDAYINILRGKEFLAPLHIPNTLKEIQSCKEHFPDTSIIAASDSAFHKTLPLVAREFSIDSEEAVAMDIHRFGYHGLSVSSVVHRVHSVLGQDPKRLIVCHLGSGVSVTAVLNKVSVETSMGYSPVGGIPMGNRAGDLDVGALIEIMRLKNMRASEAALYIYTCGGLFGMAGENDLRRLLDRKAHADTKATAAIESFIYHIKKAIAAATISLKGVDCIVLTGTAGVRSAELRSLLLTDMGHLGCVVDEDKNSLMVGREGVISQNGEAVKIVVMRTDEMGEMALIAEQYLPS